ncbi:MAG: indole-3-glycerol-phosphate synthase, partial [Candidatus Altiarchaeota archaeon]|nr:indole-3-glycerol-phosphate synthase [Candidatus Altiarchaeota archaeon]
PVLRKDFIVDMRQLDESYAYGADAVLLIVSLLKDETRNYVEKAHEIGLECLVEIHEKDEVEYALDSGAKIIGVNSRNLKNLKVDLGIFDELIPLVKKGRLVVAESGIKNKKDILRVKNAGADAVLIGTSLVKSGSAADMLRELMT